ncbi:hypothetical protein ABPG72_014240 [Tetrahymena utriculariae]
MIISSLENLQNLDYENTKEFILYMSNQDLQENDLIQIKDAILKFKKLEILEINFSYNNLDLDACFLLSQAITEGGLNLKNLYLNLKGVYFNRNDFKDLTSGISNCNFLTSLTFEFPMLDRDSSGIENFCKMVQKLINLENLSLQFENKIIQRIELRYISEGISKCFNLKSLSLDFKTSLLVNSELLNIAIDLKQLKYLKTLSFKFSKNQSQQNLNKARQICYKFKQLIKLDLHL